MDGREGLTADKAHTHKGAAEKSVSYAACSTGIHFASPRFLSSTGNKQQQQPKACYHLHSSLIDDIHNNHKQALLWLSYLIITSTKATRLVHMSARLGWVYVV